MNKYETKARDIKIGPFSWKTRKVSRTQRKSTLTDTICVIRIAFIILLVGILVAYALGFPGTEHINTEKVNTIVEVLRVLTT